MIGEVASLHLSRGGLVIVARRGEELIVKGFDGHRTGFWRIDAAGKWWWIGHLDAAIIAFDADQRLVPRFSI
jgi:hypothetical protein